MQARMGEAAAGQRLHGSGGWTARLQQRLGADKKWGINAGVLRAAPNACEEDWAGPAGGEPHAGVADLHCRPALHPSSIAVRA